MYLNIIIAFSFILAGYTGMYLMKLNRRKNFLNHEAFTMLGLFSILANFGGAFLCIKLLLGI